MEEDEDEDAPRPKKMKGAKEQSQEDNDGESENDNSDSEEDEEDYEPEEAEKESKDKKSKRSHHKVFKCRMPQCSAKVGDLKRHLLFHVRKKEIDEESLPKALAIMKAGKKQRGPSFHVENPRLVVRED